MSRKGNGWDNAGAEALLVTEVELEAQARSLDARDVGRDIAPYIDGFYNELMLSGAGASDAAWARRGR